jgi:uncharacterized protein
MRARVVMVAAALAALLLGLLWARPAARLRTAPRLLISPTVLRADGYDRAILFIEARTDVAPRISIVENSHDATVEEVAATGTGWQARIRAGVLPGHMILRVETPGFAAATAELHSQPVTGDSIGDGTPDVLRLNDERDERAFRRWFTFLAEIQYFQKTGARPAEINDCAALIRYAYREALRQHDGRWAADTHLPFVPGMESVARYQYPYTPLGPAIFHAGNGKYAEFADAQTLQRANTFFITRDLARALPGDLLFYKQDSDHMPFHSMIYLGESQIERGAEKYVVYHTGPDNDGPGEIRRLTLTELLHFPEAEWRPLASNPAFLGVFRWNILRKTS